MFLELLFQGPMFLEEKSLLYKEANAISRSQSTCNFQFIPLIPQNYPHWPLFISAGVPDLREGMLYSIRAEVETGTEKNRFFEKRRQTGSEAAHWSSGKPREGVNNSLVFGLCHCWSSCLAHTSDCKNGVFWYRWYCSWLEGCFYCFRRNIHRYYDVRLHCQCYIVAYLSWCCLFHLVFPAGLDTIVDIGLSTLFNNQNNATILVRVVLSDRYRRAQKNLSTKE